MALLLLPFLLFTLLGTSLLYFSVSELNTQLRQLFIKPDWITLQAKLTESHAEQVILPPPVFYVQSVYLTQTHLSLEYSYKNRPKKAFFQEKEFFWGEIEAATHYLEKNFPKGKIIPLYLNQKDPDEVVIDEKKLKRNKIKASLLALLYLILSITGLTILGLSATGILTQFKI